MNKAACRCTITVCWLGLIGTLLSCSLDQETASVELNSANQKAETVKTQQQFSASLIPTESFEPTPIEITVKDLPQPYATESVSNRPQVIPVPANPLLQVPAGFQVNVFAEEVNRPRWMSLTPEGDVLVAESYV